MKKSIYFLVAIISFLLLSCTGGVVEMVEKFEERLDSIKQLKSKRYNIGRKKYSEIAKKIDLDSIREVRKEEIKSKNLDNEIANIRSQLSNSNLENIEDIINLEIKSIDLKNYPDSVSLFVSLTDNNGTNITGLGYPYLSQDSIPFYWKFLSENCLTDKVEYENFNVEEIRFDSSPKTAVYYLLDYSASMQDEIVKTLRDAVKKMIYHTKKDDEIGLTLMSSEVNKEIPLTSNLDEAKNILALDSAKIKRSGNEITKPFNTMIDDLKESDSEKKIIVMFSDGIFMPDEVDSVLNYAIRNEISIYTVTYHLQMNNPEILTKLSSETGGESYFILSKREIPYVFAEIYLGLNNYYKITYKPADCNGVHNVGLILDLPELNLPYFTAKSDYLIPIFEKPEIAPKINLDINFASASSEIEERSRKLLDEIIPKLKAYKELDIVIIGHTDDIGSEEDNQLLSEKRAESVKNYFISQGLESSRLKSIGKGESEHIAPNDTENNRRKNRRTEINLIK